MIPEGWSELMQQVYCYFLLRMGKRAHITIVTAFNSAWIALAEFNFIFFRMIKLFNSIVCFRARVP
jgi:hypothetical protein